MSENAYKRWFRQQCALDGLDLGVADALRKLRAGASVKGGGWQRLLQRTIEWNRRREEAQKRQRQQGQRDEQQGRAA